MLTLPPLPTRWELTAFLLSIIVTSLAVAAAAAVLLGQWGLLGLAAALSPVLALVAANPQATAAFYRAWNGASRTYSGAASVVLVAVAFYVLVLSARVGASSEDLLATDRDGGRWRSQATQPYDSYPSESRFRIPQSVGPLRTFTGWAWRSGNVWSVGLVPTIWLVRSLDTSDIEKSRDLPAANYTLY
jgi:hypothetical protein